MPLIAGEAAPDFHLPLGDGGTVTRAGLAGRPAVLYFYPKDDTTGCTLEARDFSALAPDFAAAGIALVGVSPDSVASHAKFARKHELNVPLASDPSTAMLTAYGVWKEKSMYGRKYMGVERTTVLIDAAGRVVRVWAKVKVAGHAAEVLAAARALAG